MRLWGSAGLVLIALLLGGALGASTTGGGYSTFVKRDFVAGNSPDTRVGGGEQPAGSFGNSTSLLCGRLGVIDAIACVGVAPPSNVTVGGGSWTCPDDYRPKTRVGLRRLNWLQSGGRNTYIYPLPT